MRRSILHSVLNLTSCRFLEWEAVAAAAAVAFILQTILSIDRSCRSLCASSFCFCSGMRCFHAHIALSDMLYAGASRKDLLCAGCCRSIFALCNCGIRIMRGRWFKITATTATTAAAGINNGCSSVCFMSSLQLSSHVNPLLLRHLLSKRGTALDFVPSIQSLVAPVMSHSLSTHS